MDTYIKIYDKVLKIDKLNLSDKLILSLIIQYYENDSVFSMSNIKIANRLNISVRNVNYSIEKLIKLKIISCDYDQQNGIASNRIIRIIASDIIELKDFYVQNKDILVALKSFKDKFGK